MVSRWLLLILQRYFAVFPLAPVLRGEGGVRGLPTIGVVVLLAALLPTKLLIAGQPIPADKRLPASIVRTISATDQPMHMPTDVAVDSTGRVFVADGANDRLIRFTPDGKLDATLTGPEDQKLRRPIGLKIDSQDRLWIADTGNHRIAVLDGDGKLIQIMMPPPMDESDQWEPTDVAVTADGSRTYVVDNKHHRLLVRANASRKWITLGSSGRALGQFQWPFMVCIGQDNYVYISEAIGARVQRLSPQDKWAGAVGQWGVELGQMYRPKGVVADTRGRLYVSDSTMGVVQVFGVHGAVEGVLTGKDGLPLRFQHPMGMCFDAKGQLYVVELAANRVAVVSLTQVP